MIDSRHIDQPNIQQAIVEFDLKALEKGWDRTHFKTIFPCTNSRVNPFFTLVSNLNTCDKEEIYEGILNSLFKGNHRVYIKMVCLDLPDSIRRYFLFTALRNAQSACGELKVMAFINEYPCMKSSKKQCFEIEQKLSLIKWIHSHQVRGPIANIQGIAEILEEWDSLSEEEISNTIQYLKDSVNKLDENLKRFVLL